MSKVYLFDSNILVHLIRESPLADYVRQVYNPLIIDPRPAISVVTEGELRTLATQWQWGERKRDQMRFLLQFFLRVPVDKKEVFRAYVAMDFFSESIGRPMGKNDLWIAAAAHAIGATLVTTDTDFNHLSPGFISVDWVNSEQFKTT